MFEKIQKRDGTVVDFDSSKITTAIYKAGEATGEFCKNTAEKLTERVLAMAVQSNFGPLPSVENIQDAVEKILFASPYFKAAKAYILYRDQHAQIRGIEARANVELVENYLKKLDWKINENSNMSYSLQGLNNYISSGVTSKYWLNRIYPPEIRDAHESGAFHIHDLNLLSVYCVGWDLMDLLKKGFNGVEGKVSSSPPNHFRSALGQIVNFFYTLQGEAAGAQAFSNFDTLLAPFIRSDGLGYNMVKQALQEFVFNINIPTRVGFQTPFTNVTLDLSSPVTYKNQPAVIGGRYQHSVYSDFQREMDIFNRAFAEVMMEGDAKGRVFTFPIPTYNITSDFDWDNPNLDMILKLTGKYGVPYFSNFVNSGMSPEEVMSMCCRFRADTKQLQKRGGGLFGSYPLTGSIGVVTLNMPRIGYLSRNENDFYERLDRLILLAQKSLSIKRKVLEKFAEGNLYPYSKFYLRNIKQKTGEYWAQHYSTLGIIGMNEACLNFLNKGIDSEIGQGFSLKVMDFINTRLTESQKKDNVMYNLEATPAEGTSYRFALLDKKRCPKILCANEKEYKTGAEPFYTNSTQLPVNYSDDVFETLIHQDDLQVKYTGGTVLHIYLGEQVWDSQALKQLIKKIVCKFRLPYFTFTPTFSVCPSHGYLKGCKEKCPTCYTQTEIYSRIVGYLRPVKQWNDGKKAEFSIRKPFNFEPIK